jgi:drug/metabolite transporter (DMT)-like permease
MEPLIILFFVIIGAMRVVQKVCSKTVSDKISGDTYLHYGGYYQLIAAALSLLALFYYGFSGFNTTMVLCSVGMAAFIALGLFSEIEALKGASLILVQMFAAGSIVLSALFGHFCLEGQEMNVYQWLCLVAFLISIYFMISPDSAKKEKTQDPEAEEPEQAPTKPKQKISIKTLIMLALLFIAEGGMMIVQTIFGTLVKDGNTALFSFVMFAINSLVLYICYLVQALFFKKPKMAQTENGETIKEKSKEKALKPLSKTLLICGAFLAFALFMINILVTELTAAVVPALLFSLSSAIAIIVTMLVGRFVYGEKMSVRNVIGIVLCAGSLAMISFL